MLRRAAPLQEAEEAEEAGSAASRMRKPRSPQVAVKDLSVGLDLEDVEETVGVLNLEEKVRAPLV